MLIKLYVTVNFVADKKNGNSASTRPTKHCVHKVEKKGKESFSKPSGCVGYMVLNGIVRRENKL